MTFTQRAVITTSPLSNDAEVFPVLTGQGFLASKRPVWQTTVKRAYSGREVRAAAYSYPRWEWTLQWEVLRTQASLPELQTLFGFLGSRQGRNQPFYYQDQTDNAVTTQGFGTGDGTTTIFQLYRTVGQGTIYNYLDPVLVLNQNPSVYVNGTLKTLGTDYTISINGVISFTTAPAASAALTWSGGYLFLCRFDDEMVDAVQFGGNLWSVGKLTFVSVKA